MRQVNARLSRHGFRLGPDPASEIACTIGGVVSNNSSGMACGITENTYRTLESLVFVLPSGTVVDSGARDADAALRAAEPELVERLMRLRDRVVSNPTSVEIIRRQFAMKNTMGYAVNAFLDFETPAQLLAHLIVGSEGTLAFVAEATYRTVPILPRMATALTVFPDLDAATQALPELVATGAATLELMDATSLRVGQSLAGAPRQIAGLTVRSQAALLVEYHAHDDEELAAPRRPRLPGPRRAAARGGGCILVRRRRARRRVEAAQGALRHRRRCASERHHRPARRRRGARASASPTPARACRRCSTGTPTATA